MRNLNQELEVYGLTWLQRESVIQWINTLTQQDLSDNGSPHANFYSPPGDEPYEHLPDDYFSLESKIQRFFEDVDRNIQGYRDREEKLILVKDIRDRFNLTLKQAKQIVDKNW